MSENKLILSLGIILLIIGMGITPAVTSAPYKSNIESTLGTLEYSKDFSNVFHLLSGNIC